MKYTLLSVLAAILVASSMAYAVVVDRARESTSDCVVRTARAQGYTGNVYGPEAWDLFANSCK